MTGRISELPFRSRLAVCLAYLVAIGLLCTVVTISFLRGSPLVAGIALGLETSLVIDLARRG